jgi:hypothetical protein
MTSRQRVETALRRQQPDRTPMFEYVLLSPIADRLLGRLYAGDPANWPAVVEALGWEGAARQNAVDRVELACLLGHDLVYAVPNPPPDDAAASGVPPAAGAGADDPVERLRARNDEAARADPRPRDECLLVYVQLKEEMRRRGLDLPILAPAYAHGVWTDVDLMQTMALAPEIARQHFRLATRRSLAAIEAYAALGLDLAGVGGDFAGNRPILSPAMYRRFIVPEVRTAARRARALGLWAVNASDGDLWPVIDDFLAGCDVDAYLEIDMGAGMDLRRLKAAYGDRFAFFGNMDCGNLLSTASADEVRQATIDCLDAGQGSGHVFCASNAIVASVPIGNYLAMLNAYRAYFGLPEFRHA